MVFDKDKWLKRAGQLLIITYIVMMAVMFVYANNHEEQYTYREKPLDKVIIQINYTKLNITPVNPTKYYTPSEINHQKTKYFLFYLFNATCIMGYLWFDPDKRKRINNIENKIMRLMK